LSHNPYDDKYYLTRTTGCLPYLLIFLQGTGYRFDLQNLVQVLMSIIGRWVMTVERMNFVAYCSDAPPVGFELDLLINFLFWVTF